MNAPDLTSEFASSTKSPRRQGAFFLVSWRLGCGKNRCRSAFTLLELLVTLAVIAAAAAALTWTLRTPAGAVALQAGQGTLTGLCAAARARAALAGVNTRLAVSADPADADGVLRWWQVVREDAANPGCWLADGGGFRLPRGVYVVPPPGAAVPGAPSWPAARRSTAFAASAQAMTINGAAAGSFYYLQFTPRGTTGGGNLVVAAGRPEPTGLFPCVLDNPDAVRGVLVRSSGAVTLLSDAGAFGP